LKLFKLFSCAYILLAGELLLSPPTLRGLPEYSDGAAQSIRTSVLSAFLYYDYFETRISQLRSKLLRDLNFHSTPGDILLWLYEIQSCLT
jgi:hypothetical protein